MVEELKEALRLLQCGWTQGAYARDARLELVGISSEHAVCWCAQGAIIKANSEHYRSIVTTMNIINVVAKALPEPYTDVVAYNDEPGRTFWEVKAVFERAIANVSSTNT